MRRKFLVSGSVQGVGFRYFAREEGRRIGLSGWVRNLKDGRVEAMADGIEPELAEFEEVLKRGPAGASVTDIHSEDISVEGPLLMSFEIRHLGNEK